MSNIQYKFYLIVSHNGTLEVRKRLPGMTRNQIAIPMTVLIPEEAFQSCTKVVTITVPEDQIVRQTVEVMLGKIEDGDEES